MFPFICSYNKKFYYSIVAFALHATLLDEIMLQLPRMQCKNHTCDKNGAKILEYF